MNKPEHRGHIRMLGEGFTKGQVFGTHAGQGMSTSESVSSVPKHKPEYVQQLESRVSQLETILRSIAPTQFAGASSSSAVPPTQTQPNDQQPYVPQPYVPQPSVPVQQSYVPQPVHQPQTTQATDQSVFPDFDFDNMPAHIAEWLNSQPWNEGIYHNQNQDQ
ncbi:hypothetical protein LINPERHAP1_LOCUS18769, partial [Linum perenne]